MHFSTQVRHAISARDQRLTMMVVKICLCYLVANLPLMLAKAAGLELKWPAMWQMFLALYWTQYSTNFVIYAASNKQYRYAIRNVLPSKQSTYM